VRIQRVVMPVTGTESWTVLGGDDAVVAPAERYLAYLSALERSPNTVRAYATSLMLWFEFLIQARAGWAEAGVEDVARFVAWLRAPAGNVIVLETGTGRRSPATVNRHLAAVFGFTTTTPATAWASPATWLPGAGSAAAPTSPSCTM
jgi:integrase/recombinase XerD